MPFKCFIPSSSCKFPFSFFSPSATLQLWLLGFFCCVIFGEIMLTRTETRLLFMTYNGWIMLAVGVGAFVGYLVFGNSTVTKSAACH
jgi:amino acid permease